MRLRRVVGSECVGLRLEKDSNSVEETRQVNKLRMKKRQNYLINS